MSRPAFLAMSRAALSLAAVLACTPLWAAEVKLSGDQEVPPVQTSASGSGQIDVAADGSVSGSVRAAGVDGSMAHIHQAPPGKNGGVLIPLSKGSDGQWLVPAGAKLTDDQMKAWRAGELYVNVHSAAHPGGEIRGQLKP